MTDEHGVVALETLLVLPVLVTVVLVVLLTGTVVADHLAVGRAARAAARTVALTGEVAGAAAVARSVHPDAAATVVVRGGIAHVTVRLRGDVAGVHYDVETSAAAPLEPVARR